jgi:hypothetical protein
MSKWDITKIAFALIQWAFNSYYIWFGDISPVLHCGIAILCANWINAIVSRAQENTTCAPGSN